MFNHPLKPIKMKDFINTCLLFKTNDTYFKVLGIAFYLGFIFFGVACYKLFTTYFF